MSHESSSGDRYDIRVVLEASRRDCYRIGCSAEAIHKIAYRREGEPHQYFQSFCDTHLPSDARTKLMENFE